MNQKLKMGTAEPTALFKEWLADAGKLEPVNPEAAALATTTGEGHPTVRMVLIKEVDDRGFVFYTNSASPTGEDIRATGRASLSFYWKALRRQVRVDGTAEKITPGESDAYFATRARSSQIGAWASKQSRPMHGRFELAKRIVRYTAKFSLRPVPRPPLWDRYRRSPYRTHCWR